MEFVSCYVVSNIKNVNNCRDMDRNQKWSSQSVSVLCGLRLIIQSVQSVHACSACSLEPNDVGTYGSLMYIPASLTRKPL